MSHNERDAWNRRYSGGAQSLRPPDEFLIQAYEQYVAPAFPQGGDALDVAGGAGRHALYLAEHNWRVTLVDIAELGIKQAEDEAQRRGVHIRTVCSDTREYDFGNERYDLIVVFLYLDRALFSNIARALRPGGCVVYMTYTEEHQKFAPHGTAHPMYFLHPGELRDAFPGFDLLHFCEGGREPGLAQLVARKPKLQT